MIKHFTTLRDITYRDAFNILVRAKEMKELKYKGESMHGKVAALIFEKASTRTRTSFEVAIHHLGGNSIFLTPNETQIGRNEPIKDTARVLSTYVDCIIIRTFEQKKVDQFAEVSSIPIINALTDQGHPCQVMADILTIYEKDSDLTKIRIAWVGDSNNVLNSWIEASMHFPFMLSIATPQKYSPPKELIDFATNNGANIFLTNEPAIAVTNAQYVYTDVWASMGQENEQNKRIEDFKNFHVDATLMNQAAPKAKFLHCLPAHRGEEVSDEIIEGSCSLVWEQAENKLHIQKAILEWIFQ